jgi:hypothetical protein
MLPDLTKAFGIYCQFLMENANKENLVLTPEFIKAREELRNFNHELTDQLGTVVFMGLNNKKNVNIIVKNVDLK